MGKVAENSASRRSTSWWLRMLQKRAERMYDDKLDLSDPIEWSSEAERQAAIAFFNAAFRAEESGLRQAHDLAEQVAAWDPELAECLRLYGNEEGWHRELLTEFLDYLGGTVKPMGKVTGTFFHVYGQAKRIETIVLTNLMFETIGSTTYRLALRHVRTDASFATLRHATPDDSQRAVATQEEPDPFLAKMREAASGGDPKAAMLKISDDATDPFATPLQRFEATVRLFRFQPTGKSLLDWAAIQSGLADPMSRYNRHELEKFFEQWCIGRDNHLRKVAQELRKADPGALQRAITQAPSVVQQTLRRLDAFR